MIMSYLFRFDKHLHRGAYIRPSVVGSHSLRAGMYVTSISEMKIATKNGTRLFITFSRRCFANEHPTNRTLPTGGVMVPTARFMTIITPNCTSKSEAKRS